MRILLGDDHALFRDGLRLQLRDLDPDVEILDAADFDQLLAIVAEQGALDLALVDLSMPGMDWRLALRRLNERFPDLPVVVVSASDNHSDILQALDSGAAGFIPKSSSGSVMLRALQLVFSGGTYVPPEVLRRVSTPRAPSSSAEEGGLERQPSLLTPRQVEVLRLLAEGQSNKEIAAVLDLSDGTVKLHVTAILKALGVNNRTRAVLAAARLGLLPSS